VHGQVITAWAKKYSINKILVIDDEIAQDPFMSQVITLSAQAGMDITILEVVKAVEYLRNVTAKGNLMLLFKNPKSVLELSEAGYILPEVNLGNLGSSPNRKRISKNVSLSEEEGECIKKIVALGTYVYLQMVPTDPQIDVTSILQKN
jgi:PTS system mannose-specific IIB component